jgi:hypothetical protein
MHYYLLVSPEDRMRRPNCTTRPPPRVVNNLLTSGATKGRLGRARDRCRRPHHVVKHLEWAMNKQAKT